MEDSVFIEKITAFNDAEDVLSVNREVNELRSKFEDHLIEEERKVQVAEIQAQESKTTIDPSVNTRKEELIKLKDDFHSILTSYKDKRKAIQEEQNAIETNNLKEKSALVKQLKEVVSGEENIGAAFGALKEIQEKWKTIGPVPRDKRNDVETEYAHLLDDFFYNIKIYKELKDHDFHRNHQLKSSVIDELKKLNSIESIKEVDAQLKKLQNDWNDIGPVPNEEWDALKEAYWTEVRSIYNKINRYYDDRRAQLSENLKQKEALLQETKDLNVNNSTLDSVKSWDKATKIIKDLQAKWKSVGFGPKKENDAIWKEFRAECDVFFNAKKDFFSEVHKEFDSLAEKKKVLVDKAKELSVSTDWRETANQLKKLQSQWKQIGHSGVKHEQKLWKQFRAACDAFFNSRDKHFNQQEEQFESNLKSKKELLKKFEGYKPDTDKSKALVDIKAFTEEFNAIGHVPMKEKDVIFKSFKTILDKLYTDLEIEGAEKDTILFKAKIDTIKASPNAFKLYRDLRSDLRNEIDKETKEITLLENNLGFFANSKGADALKQQVEEKVNKAKERITAIKAQLKLIPNE